MTPQIVRCLRVTRDNVGGTDQLPDQWTLTGSRSQRGDAPVWMVSQPARYETAETALARR